MRQISIALLRFAERVFLRAHGWKYLGNDRWAPPDNYARKRVEAEYRGGHAINSQKYTNSSMSRLGRRLEDDGREA